MQENRCEIHLYAMCTKTVFNSNEEELCFIQSFALSEHHNLYTPKHGWICLITHQLPAIIYDHYVGVMYDN